jgi:hypothetical protein
MAAKIQKSSDLGEIISCYFLKIEQELTLELYFEKMWFYMKYIVKN